MGELALHKGFGVETSQGMTRDAVCVAVLLVAFALLLTAHVTLALGLLRRSPRWRAPVGLVVPPLAVLWGWREGMRVRSTLWALSALLYGAALFEAVR